MKNKNILIISETFTKGGSGIATQNIFECIKSIYPNTRLMIPFHKNKVKNLISYFNVFGYFYYFFFKLLNRLICKYISTNNFYFFNKKINYPLFRIEKIDKILGEFKPDYLLVLWYEYIINYELIYRLKNKYGLKVIIYPFDMFGFTGGCRYSQSCKNYTIECKNCSALKPKYSYLAENNYSKNKTILEKINPKFIFPSSYAKEFAVSTKIFKAIGNSNIIHYPIMLKKIEESKQEIKKKYNIKENEKIIFFGAQDLREWRKGVKNFTNVISILNEIYLKNDKIKLKIICIGKDSKKIFGKITKEIIVYEKISHEELLKIYKISDLIIIPSLQEWSSLMMSEAVSLKKPVIAFKTGSSSDLIKNNLKGLVFDNFDYNDIANNIFYYLKNDKFINKKNVNIRDQEISKFNLEFIKKQFIEKVFND